MSRFMALTALVAAMVLGSPVPAMAWGPRGHNIIARVAYARLSPPQRAKFDAILALGGDLEVSWMDDKKGEQKCSAQSLDEVANWADCVRYGGRFANTYGEHFDDMPYCPKPPAPPPAKTSYCKDEECGSAAIPRYIAQLKAPGTSDFDRAAALAFIIHFVGDAHQPLHNIENANDNGGNGVVVEIPASKAMSRLSGPSCTRSGTATWCAGCIRATPSA